MQLVESTPGPESVTVGRVEAIHIAPVAEAPMVAVDRVRAIAGVGLEGDRYATKAGTWSPDPRVDRDITLIETEVLEDLAATDGIHLAPGETRRNVTTRGIRLNDLIGRWFRVGDAVCEGTRLCEPCQHLTDALGKPILRPLVHRAGLRAHILEGGDIGVGAEVAPID
ncbi:MAG TPA: MOSC domain-containing protein [Candidatus Limnocylindrales bacterium]|nr:MOSC domain-containing protein [Candidatus Limnocylindrales bacterium]